MPTMLKLLDLSLAHLDAASLGWIRKEVRDGSALAGCYEFFAGTHRDPDQPDNFLADDGRALTLTRILSYAVRHDCDGVLFDADAPFAPVLPVFDEQPDIVILTSDGVDSR